MQSKHIVLLLACSEFLARVTILDKAKRKHKLQRLPNLLKLNEPLPQYVQSTHLLLHSGFRLQFTNQLLKHLSPKAATDWSVNKSFYRENFSSIMEAFHLIWDDVISYWSWSTSVPKQLLIDWLIKVSTERFHFHNGRTLSNLRWC